MVGCGILDHVLSFYFSDVTEVVKIKQMTKMLHRYHCLMTQKSTLPWDIDKRIKYITLRSIRRRFASSITHVSLESSIFLYNDKNYMVNNRAPPLWKDWQYVCRTSQNKPEITITALYYRCSLHISDNTFYFIPRSEFSAYLKQIKIILSAVKKYRIFH